MKKNDVVRLKIEDMGVNGEGIGKVDGYTLFVKDAVIGDVIEAKIMKAKKKLWICTIDTDIGGITGSCRGEMSGGASVWGMSDSANVVSKTACI